MPPSRPLSTGSSSFHATYWFENGSIGAMLQPTARPLPRPILGLAVSESEMGFAAVLPPKDLLEQSWSLARDLGGRQR